MTPTMSLDPFMLGTVSVTPTDSGGYWIRVREGRSRFIQANSETAKRIASGYELTKLDAAARTMAAGTHEPVVYFRNADGKIGIPPDPSMIPFGCERLEARNLRDLDKLSAEMNQDHYRDFQDDGAFTEGMDEMLGSPRQYLVDRLQQGGLSNLNRDLIHECIKHADFEASQRQKITTDTRFRIRDYDGGR